MLFNHKVKAYAFVGPSGTGKSYRAQMVAGDQDIKFSTNINLIVIWGRDNLQLFLPLIS